MEEGKTQSTGMIAALPKIPEQIRFLFGKPPLIIGEDRKAYDELVRQMALVVQPKDLVAWMLLKDYADLTFEILRWRRAKAGIINVSRKEGLRSILESIIEASEIPHDSDRAREADTKTDQWYQDSDTRRAVRQQMERYDLLDHSDSITAQAIALRCRELETLESMIASAEARRARVLAQLEHYQVAAARRRAELEDVIDVEPEELAALPSGPDQAIGLEGDLVIQA